jgi:hypothetical protein
MPKNFNLFCFGDAHVGSVMFYEKGFDCLLNMVESEYDGIKPKHNFSLDHGDSIEAITVDDRKRFDLATTREFSLLKQVEYYVDKVRPLASGGRLVTVLDGNHTRSQRTSGEWAQEIASRLNVPFGTFTSRISYVGNDGKLLFKHFAGHGWGSINSSAKPLRRAVVNMEIALRAALERKAGDCLLMTMGHTHKLLIHNPEDYLFLYSEDGVLKEGYTNELMVDPTAQFLDGDFRWYGNTGCFRRTSVENISDYGEQKGYDPIQLGFLVAKIREGKLVKVEKVRI